MPESFEHPVEFANAHASESMAKGGIHSPSDILWCHINYPSPTEFKILHDNCMLDKPLAKTPDKGSSAVDTGTDENDLVAYSFSIWGTFGFY